MEFIASKAHGIFIHLLITLKSEHISFSFLQIGFSVIIWYYGVRSSNNKLSKAAKSTFKGSLQYVCYSDTKCREEMRDNSTTLSPILIHISFCICYPFAIPYPKHECLHWILILQGIFFCERRQRDFFLIYYFNSFSLTWYIPLEGSPLLIPLYELILLSTSNTRPQREVE